MSDNTRLQAALFLQETLEQKTFSVDTKKRFLSTDSTNNAFFNMLTQTAFRHLVYTKKVIKQFTTKKLPSNTKLAFYLLVLGATEVIYLKTPDYAIINSYVEIAKTQLNKYVAGFVNAVLRKICQNKQLFTEADKGEFFPQEFRRLINASYNKKTCNKIEQASTQEPLLDITTKTTYHIPNAISLPLGTLRLNNNGNITQIPGFSEGLWWAQDFSASLPVKLLNNIQGLNVLDICAAPGGKTAQLISLGANVTALDISSSRLQKLQENLQRLNLKASNIICADALEWLTQDTSPLFDIILLDAPCSATGTLRRHPEIVHTKNINDVQQMAEIQKKLLNLCPKHLKKGGRLIYCTCSLSKIEGETQIEQFLQNNPSFTIIKPQLPQELSELQSSQGWIRILPSHLANLGGADGFFIAILTKE